MNSYDNWFWIVQNAELFTLTYGAIVRQLLTDLEEAEEVNKQLDQMYVSESLFLLLNSLNVVSLIFLCKKSLFL